MSFVLRYLSGTLTNRSSPNIYQNSDRAIHPRSPASTSPDRLTFPIFDLRPVPIDGLYLSRTLGRFRSSTNIPLLGLAALYHKRGSCLDCRILTCVPRIPEELYYRLRRPAGGRIISPSRSQP